MINSVFKNIETDFPQYDPELIHSEPGIVVFDKFLNEDECTKLKKIPPCFHLSGLANGSDNINYRNSLSFVCNGDYLKLDIIQKIQKRIETIVKIKKENFEEMVITKYNKGGFYGKHHDFILEETNPENFKKLGPRILTFLIYLSDVDDGGQTCFFHLNKSVEPKMGRAILWTNVLDNLDKNELSAHEALKVLEGEKYISQTWIHSKQVIFS